MTRSSAHAAARSGVTAVASSDAAGQRDGGLDLLRGVAALSVVLFHLWLYARPAPSAAVHGLTDAIWSAGRLGLVLFFVLSGYLLYRPWVQARRHATAPPSLRRYLQRRAAAGFALLIVCARDADPGRNLARRTLTWIGTVSFGLYLWHVPVIWWLRSMHILALDPLTALPVVLSLSLALAAISWHLVEQPIIRRARAGTDHANRPTPNLRKTARESEPRARPRRPLPAVEVR